MRARRLRVRPAPQAVEVATAAQQQRLAQHLCQVAVCRLDGTIPVHLARRVAGRLHAVMGAQIDPLRGPIAAPRLIAGDVATEIAERGGEAVADAGAGIGPGRPQYSGAPPRKQTEALDAAMAAEWGRQGSANSACRCTSGPSAS